MRKIITFNDNWRFLEHDMSSNHSYIPMHEIDFDDSDWRVLSVPHDSSIEAPFAKENPSTARGGYASNILCYYRKHFTLDESDEGKKILVTFDGVYCNATFYVNGEELDTYYFGYTSLTYDISDYLYYDGEDNVIAVKVDNEVQPGSRWYTGTGIYRPVTLSILDPIYIDRDETVITTPVCDEESADIMVSTTLCNDTAVSIPVACLKVEIAEKNGNVVASKSQNVHLGFSNTNKLSVGFDLKNPKLWCNTTPNMYTCTITLMGKSGVEGDKISVDFGIRTVSFTPDNGFIINGKKEVLKGVCIHHDNGMLGSCAYRDAFIKKIEAVKAMGANAIRTTHNPEAPEFLELCDEYGMYVMEEAFDEWSWGKRPRIFGDVNKRVPIFSYAKYFNDFAEKDLSAMIIRDRNHPSIVIWSIGNEIEELRHEAGEELTAMLSHIVHEHDNTRLTTAGCNGLAAINETENPDIMDVCGYNYAEEFYTPDHIRVPSRPMVGTETSSATAFEPRACYDGFLNANPNAQTDENADPEEQSIQAVNTTNTMNRLRHAEESWMMHVKNPHVAGLFIWTGIDYIGEPTPHTWPSISSYFAPIDRALFPKDAFYFYKSIWSDEDVLHILPHWTLGAEYIGKKIPVWCYTNCDEVELFVNGVSVGKQIMDKDITCHMEFDSIEYQEGELKAVGIRNGKTIETIIKTAGDVAKIGAESDKSDYDVNRLAYVTVSMLDSNENLVPNAVTPVTFTCSDGLKLLGTDNGLETNITMKSSTVETLGGLARAVFMCENSGEATITMTSGNMSSTISLNVK